MGDASAGANNPCGDGIAHHLHAHAADGRAQHVARLLVELRHHQLRRRLKDRHLDIVRQESARGLESEQASADDGGAPAAFGVVGDAVAVVDRAKQKRARSTEAVHGRNERPRARGNNHVVVGRLDERGVVFASRVSRIRQGVFLQRRADHDAPIAIDTRGPDAGMERDAVVAVPRQRIHEDVRGGLRAVEHVAQEDTVVVAVGLGPEHDDVEAIGCPSQDLFDHPGAGHAVAHDDELFSIGLGHHCVRILSALTRALRLSAATTGGVMGGSSPRARRTACSSAPARSDRTHSA